MLNFIAVFFFVTRLVQKLGFEFHTSFCCWVLLGGGGYQGAESILCMRF